MKLLSGGVSSLTRLKHSYESVGASVVQFIALLAVVK
jgi:hypothetical protein